MKMLLFRAQSTQIYSVTVNLPPPPPPPPPPPSHKHDTPPPLIEFLLLLLLLFLFGTFLLLLLHPPPSQESRARLVHCITLEKNLTPLITRPFAPKGSRPNLQALQNQDVH